MTTKSATGAAPLSASSRVTVEKQLARSRLLEEARGGSNSRLGDLLETCRTYLQLVAAEELPNDIRQKIGASDLVQETLHDALLGFDRFRGNSPAELLGWLRRILLNNARDATRSYRVIAKRQVRREISLDQGSHNPAGAGLVCKQPSPSGQAIQLERRVSLFKAIERLDERARQVVRWRNLEQLSFVEISRRLEITEDSARKIWSRAVQNLTRELRTIDET